MRFANPPLARNRHLLVDLTHFWKQVE